MQSRKPQMPPLITFLILSLIFSHAASEDDAKDKQECTDAMVGLATCLPFVEGQGNAKIPTPDCCNGLKQVLKTNKKCLCLVVKHRNDPDLGLNINGTLALELPQVCHAHANVSKCPDLLHMDPNSPDAQIFYQFGKGTSKNVGSPASSPTAIGAGAPGVMGGQKNDSGKGWFKVEVFITILLSLCVSLCFFP